MRNGPDTYGSVWRRLYTNLFGVYDQPYNTAISERQFKKKKKPLTGGETMYCSLPPRTHAHGIPNRATIASNSLTRRGVRHLHRSYLNGLAVFDPFCVDVWIDRARSSSGIQTDRPVRCDSSVHQI
jgi:hypothetical protein